MIVIWSIVILGILAAALFGSAGTFAIAGFWAYWAIVAALTAAGPLLVEPDLAQERLRPGGKPIGSWAAWVSALAIAHLVTAGLDRGRLHISHSMPVAVQVAALLAFALANAAVLWAMHVNRFFSSVPRIQSERGHRVISEGPYRWLRHPGYAAAIVMIVASGLALGSWLAALIALVGIPLILRRAVVEDRMLLAELPGYRDYAARVRYRLLPGLW